MPSLTGAMKFAIGALKNTGLSTSDSPPNMKYDELILQTYFNENKPMTAEKYKNGVMSGSPIVLYSFTVNQSGSAYIAILQTRDAAFSLIQQTEHVKRIFASKGQLELMKETTTLGYSTQSLLDVPEMRLLYNKKR